MNQVETSTTTTSWHAMSSQEVLGHFNSSPEGLSEDDAEQRLGTYGSNLIPPPKKQSALMRLVAQFHNVLIYVLLVAGVVTALLEHLVDAGVIIGVVMINGLIGFIQEGKAEKAIDAVRNMLSAQATVIRSGRRYQMSAEELVPGDIVFIQSGDRVPADMFGTMLPVTAAQILWVNMITAVSLALALVFEPAESDVMQRRPRDIAAPMLSGFMTWRILFVSLLMVLGTFGLFLWERLQGTVIDTARTVAVNTLVVAEIFYLFNTRYLTASIFNRNGLLGNRYVLITIGVVVFFQLLFTYLPAMQHFFNTAPIDLRQWLNILGVGVVLLFAVEFEKALFRKQNANF